MEDGPFPRTRLPIRWPRVILSLLAGLALAVVGGGLLTHGHLGAALLSGLAALYVLTYTAEELS